MDKKLIYFLLGFSIFYFLYYKYVLGPMEKRMPPPEKRVVAPETPASSSAQSQSQVVGPPVQPPVPPAVSVGVMKIYVDTPLYKAELSNRGVVLTSFRLKKYKDDYGQPLEMIPQSSGGNAPLMLDFDDRNLAKIANEAVFSASAKSITLSGKEQKDLEFIYSNGTNTFRKMFRFHADTYVMDFTVEAFNGDNRIPARVTWAPGIESGKSYRKESILKPTRGLVNSGSKVQHFDAKSAKEYRKIGSTVHWVGVENNYFLAIFIPATDVAADAYMNQVTNGENARAHQVNVSLVGLRPETLRMSMFVGPKDYLLLKGLGMGLQDAVDFGFFGPIAKGLFFALRYFHGFTKNYGLAILLLTVLVKVIFTPFTQMSFSSMKKMQQMQPELKKVQDKYSKMKDDDPRKQNMNVEIMGLHKRYGVNPLGGCLPMLLQMPVLFAFYQLLSNAIELRGAPFTLWLQDLSQPDPWKITPLLMGGTMLLQQRMTPSTDPMQQKMMYIMPIMFTFMSFNFPSGLVLYWFMSNVLAIAHQYYFQRKQKPLVVNQ